MMSRREKVCHNVNDVNDVKTFVMTAKKFVMMAKIRDGVKKLENNVMPLYIHRGRTDTQTDRQPQYNSFATS